DGIFLELIFNKSTDWDAELDLRDSTEFDSTWSASYEEIISSCPSEDQLIKKIRETTFKRVYQLTKNSDLAGYASDDLGLIAQAFQNNVENDFVNMLWRAYTQGKFPN
ncbi:hypothetical protein, partial [Pseudomonas protegens]